MDTKLAGLKICLNQMQVIPGRPDLNAQYIIDEMRNAVSRGVDLIIFPEMAVPGYFIGDKLENRWFVNDVASWNEEICRASEGIVAVFGSLRIAEGEKKGEDGRHRIYNAAIVASHGRYNTFAVKTLQPNYRFFNDDKHLYSARKAAAENGSRVDDLIRPFPIDTKNGMVRLGVILCEDMWHEDYPVNPTKILVDKGADLVVNLSASPWGWQKNRKRHQVVSNLLAESPVPFVYVNNTGAQNTGKNILVFDGSSTVYGPSGDVAFEVYPYSRGGYDFVIPDEWVKAPEQKRTDTEELYAALKAGLAAQIELLPESLRHIVIGLSGGIDSAVTLALCVDVVGADHITAINMPSQYNTGRTKNLAEKIAKNFGVDYEVVPIGDMVEAVVKSVPLAEPGTLAYENVQARMRMEILAAKAQAEYEGVFTCNSNKAEFAFGYGTMYADIAGFLAPLGDLVKREVRQVAEHVNEIWGWDIIPEECIHQKPSAELATGQFDPFDYGDTNRRGYHDELIRAFTEFAADPAWVLGLYAEGKLEQQFLLDEGTLYRLFPKAQSFIEDLEKNWLAFHRAFVKRVQSPPIIVVSKRAFGRDLEEALMPGHFTKQYHELKAELLGRKSLVIFGGSFNPPGMHHQLIAKELAKRFDKVVILPCGLRPDKTSSGLVTAEHRKAMIEKCFSSIPNIQFDWSDLHDNEFTPTYLIDESYKGKFPEYDIYHAVGGDLLEGGSEGQSQIQTSWKRGEEVWAGLQFAVINHPNLPVGQNDLPPHNLVVTIPPFGGRSTEIRKRLQAGEETNGLLDPSVLAYIKQHNLYRP